MVVTDCFLLDENKRMKRSGLYIVSAVNTNDIGLGLSDSVVKLNLKKYFGWEGYYQTPPIDRCENNFETSYHLSQGIPEDVTDITCHAHCVELSDDRMRMTYSKVICRKFVYIIYTIVLSTKVEKRSKQAATQNCWWTTPIDVQLQGHSCYYTAS